MEAGDAASVAGSAVSSLQPAGLRSMTVFLPGPSSSTKSGSVEGGSVQGDTPGPLEGHEGGSVEGLSDASASVPRESKNQDKDDSNDPVSDSVGHST